MSYNNPTPVAVNIVFVRRNDGSAGVLGIQRNIAPFIGELAFPGGFVDEMESIEQAAAREFKEECGIESSADEWHLVQSRITENNRVLVFTGYLNILTEEDVAKMVPNEEVQSFVILDKNSKLCFPLHQAEMHKIFSEI